VLNSLKAGLAVSGPQVKHHPGAVHTLTNLKGREGMPEQPTNNRRPGRQAKGNNHATTFWPVTMVVGGDVELLVEGQNGDDIGLTVCSKCASLVPASDTSQQLHKNFHEAINGTDQRAT
jgi:hypothetical protein